ncbi:MAG: putative ABC transport system ATP-binding protein, partial [Kiritimatiellia bacterium]
MNTVVQVEDLRFSYKSRRDAGSFSMHVSRLRIEQGTRVGLFGPSGCGKSTLLNLIGGLLSAESGSLVVSGQELVGLSEAARRRHRIRHMGFVFQDYPLVEHLDAIENVLLPYRINSALRLTSEARGRATALLSELGLGDKLRRRPNHLSQGERQRVAIARALVTQPSLLLADEPTAGLDPERTLAVYEHLSTLCRERSLTLLMVTH